MQKKKMLIIIPLLVLLCSTAFYISFTYNYSKQWENRIYPKVSVNRVDISGETKEKALLKVEESVKASLDRKFIIEVQNKSYTLDLKTLKPKYNVDQTIQQAFNYGKEFNFLGKYRLLKNSIGKSYDLKLSYNEKAIEKFIDKIEKETYRLPKEAKIKLTNSGRFHISREVIGKKLDKEYLYKEILTRIDNNVDMTIKAKIDDVYPRITASALSKIDSQVSSFNTSYKGSPEGRKINIATATRAINGTLVMPGDVFSFNKVVGERSSSRGYCEATIILNNRFEKDYGGGVCQVSSTLYNAAIRMNLKSIERANHSLTLSYIQLGADAAVSKGIDYKFKNNSGYPIYIEGYAGSEDVTFNIYSNSSLKRIKYDLINNVYKQIKPKIIYQNDSKLYTGETEQVQSPLAGYRVKSYLVGYLNGKEISKQLISNDTYNAVNGIIRRGTKKTTEEMEIRLNSR